jgi:hypothetical protein
MAVVLTASALRAFRHLIVPPSLDASFVVASSSMTVAKQYSPTASRSPLRSALGGLGTALRWLGVAIRSVFWLAVITWGALAIYFSNLPWFWMRLALDAAFIAFSIWALHIAHTRRSVLAFAVVFAGLLLWWISIQPSLDRKWRPEVGVMPRAFIDGDRVRITGVRDFDYRSADDFTVRYEEREVSLSHLTAVNLYISYWMPGPVGHTFVSFVFDDAPPLSISIEARPEMGEGYAPVASLFKQFELIYVVGDERDLVRVRTNYRGEDVYLYRTVISPENTRRLLRVYLDRINKLADHPEFYHLLSNSCTINIVRYGKSLGAPNHFDIRHYLNGLFDAYLYDMGAIRSKLPFEELRRRSRINDAALAAQDAPDFSERIRASLPSSASTN